MYKYELYTTKSTYNNFGKCWQYVACITYRNSSQCIAAYGIGECFKTKKEAENARIEAVKYLKTNYKKELQKHEV